MSLSSGVAAATNPDLLYRHPADTASAEASPLLRQLLVASPHHRDLAATLQTTTIDLRRQLTEAIANAWRDRESILVAVVESGGIGLGGDATQARALIRPTLGEWKGVALLIAP